MPNWKMTYKNLSDKDLMKLSTEANGLLPEAQQALTIELQERKIQTKDVNTYVIESAWEKLQSQVKLPDIPRLQIKAELQNGTRIVVFQYCVSCLIFSFKKVSPVFFIKTGESPFKQSLKYSLISSLFGWWGVPWGPIWTISAIFRNFNGGIDMTENVRIALAEITE